MDAENGGGRRARGGGGWGLGLRGIQPGIWNVCGLSGEGPYLEMSKNRKDRCGGGGEHNRLKDWLETLRQAEKPTDISSNGASSPNPTIEDIADLDANEYHHLHIATLLPDLSHIFPLIFVIRRAFAIHTYVVSYPIAVGPALRCYSLFNLVIGIDEIAWGLSI
ncbi:hypothetical protein L804_02340 [Cryptococcus deuterogattii 2001/935-1]|nr:hypothetical protein L804_02340 [Cryptococcus deuterogattii 2001/935-1]